MDLKAYAQIDVLKELAEYNNIEVPRLRGYRWMKMETEPLPIYNKHKKTPDIHQIEVEVLTNLLQAEPFFDPNSYTSVYNDRIKYLYDYYIKKDGEIDCVDWSKIHGWKRRILKAQIHITIDHYNKQNSTYNKYLGREDVLMIHSRIGGGNFVPYGGPELYDKDWFIERVDDAYDSTYCDIYAKIKIPEGFEERYLKTINMKDKNDESEDFTERISITNKPKTI